MYADVIIDINHQSLDRAFQYRIPDELIGEIKPGAVVAVPFGNGNTLKKGFVTGISDTPLVAEDRIKDIHHIDDKQIPVEAKLIELAEWMRNRYGGTLLQSLTTVLPVKKRVKKRASSDVKETASSEAPKAAPLNDAQKKVLNEFISDYENGIRQTYLLFGVTGSGKTRVYMEMISKVLEHGKSVIVLIPEIALTRQNIMRFSGRFKDEVAVLHSRLSAGERYEVYDRAGSGAVKVILGPRSALFAPLNDIGLIIVDEEHETSYKSEQMPRYHAREVAIKRAAMSDASVVLGSATPSIDSLLKVKQGSYRLLTLPKRAADRPMPKTFIVDMRSELASGNRTVISGLLSEKISQRLNRKEQVILFLNRRGIAGFLSCRMCGHVMKCPHCDVSLHVHKDGLLRCHYCGYTQPSPDKCPKCGSKYIGAFKAGTQSVEKLLGKSFPDARILRMDADTTSKKGDHDRILSAFGSGKADILLGTQMIVKGHDFPGVTLVGVLAADISLNSSDYTGGERTFDLLVQAAGRAGRGEVPGEVVIQTYQPSHYAVTSAARLDVDGFYEHEIAYRRMLGYPPVGHMLRIAIQSEDRQRAQMAAGHIRDVLFSSKSPVKGSIAGPTEGVITRLKDNFRFAVYIKSPRYGELVSAKDEIEKDMSTDSFRNSFPGTLVFFDFDPIHTF